MRVGTMRFDATLEPVFFTKKSANNLKFFGPFCKTVRQPTVTITINCFLLETCDMEDPSS